MAETKKRNVRVAADGKVTFKDTGETFGGSFDDLKKLRAEGSVPQAGAKSNAGAGNTTTQTNISNSFGGGGGGAGTTQFFQQRLNEIRETALKIQSEADSLKEKENSVNSNSFVGSSSSVVQQENNILSEVQGLLTPSAAEQQLTEASQNMFDLIDSQIKQLDQQRNRELQIINQTFGDAERKLEAGQKKESGFLNTTLSRIGGFLGQSASSTGAMINLAETHRAEISALGAAKAEAILAAENAITEKQFGLAQAKAREARELEKNILDARNNFFDQSIAISKEMRLQEEAVQKRQQQSFQNSLDVAESITPGLIGIIETLDNDADIQSLIQGTANDFGIDADLLSSQISNEFGARQERVRDEVFKLAQKFPDASISPTDNFDEATTKVRGSRSYQTDIGKAEATIANTWSLLNSRENDKNVDFSNPILQLYTDTTGEIVGSPSKARGILGYTDSLLAEKEVVPDDFDGPLLDNQIKASDAQSIIVDSFANLNNAGNNEVTEGQVYQWLASDEASGLGDDEIRTEIMKLGLNPDDFGYY